MKGLRFLNSTVRCLPRVFVVRDVFLSHPCEGAGQGGLLKSHACGGAGFPSFLWRRPGERGAFFSPLVKGGLGA